MITNTSPEHDVTWEPPIPLTLANNDGSNPYPIDALPSVIQEPVKKYQQYGQQPLALIACSALGNISLACQTLANVARDHLLVSPLSLYFLLMASSGMRKTAADKTFGQAIRQWQSTTREELAPSVAEAWAIHHAWRSDRETLVRQIRQCTQASSAAVLQEQLRILLDSEPSVPLLPELYFEDVTQEGLIHTLSRGWPSSSLWSDEGGIILSGNGMQANTTKFLTTLSRLWDGNPFLAHRKTSSSIVMEHRRFTVSIMLQPLLLKQLLKRQDGIARQSGFLARTLITEPISTMGTRYYQTPPESVDGLNAFHQRIIECLNQTLVLDKKGCHDIPTLHFSSKGKARWVAFFNQIESGINKESHWQSMQDFASKAAENVARLSGLLHVFLGHNGDITVESVEQAIHIIFWHLLETKRLFEPAPAGQHQEAQKLLQWIQAKQFTETTSRFIQQYGGFREKEQRDQAIHTLVEHYYLKEEKRDGKKILLVNPKLRAN